MAAKERQEFSIALRQEAGDTGPPDVPVKFSWRNADSRLPCRVSRLRLSVISAATQGRLVFRRALTSRTLEDYPSESQNQLPRWI